MQKYFRQIAVITFAAGCGAGVLSCAALSAAGIAPYIAQTFGGGYSAATFAGFALIFVAGAIAAALWYRSRRDYLRSILRAQALLEESRQMLQLVLDTIPVRVFWKDRDSVYIGCNRAFAADAGLTDTSAAAGLTDFDLPWREYAQLCRKYDQQVISANTPEIGYTMRHPIPYKSMVYLRTSKVPLANAKGQVTGVLGIYEDITQSKADTDALRDSESRYRTLAATVPDMIYVVDGESLISYVNPATARQFDTAPEKIIGRNLADIYPPAIAERHLKAIREVIKNGREINREMEEKFLNRKIWIEVTLTPMRNADGKIIAALGISRDITERRQSEDRIRSSLKEKEVLLREIHHRVKNNLQVISSLLSLQSANIVDKRDAALFTASQERVRVMALAHEKLYQSSDLSHINFREYMESMAGSLAQICRRSDIRIQVNADPVFLTIEKAIPCGLIINELATNALKHAFPAPSPEQQSDWRITIRLEDHTANQWRLSVSDNGIGLPKESEDIQPRKLGMELVKNLTRQLNGRMTSASTDGAVFAITFPKG